ncbi:protein translocase subunit SecD [Pelagerythrobacter sp.]|uniref:protein translocase subunit SecD n=1 Tax=Pelagerythrobacter sp. TaxID=2800702 RepID=UPI0035ADC599
MLDFPLWKRGWFWGLTLACSLLALPSLVSISGANWPSALPDPEVNLGLDLAGGSHILLEADPGEVSRQRLQNMAESVNSTLDRAEPAINFGDLSTAEGRLSFMVESVADVDRVRELLEPLLNGEGLVREWNLAVEDETRVVLTPTEAGLERAVNAAMDASQDVIDRRINALGTREPTIIRQGDNRIVVQVPGLQDPEQVKELIGKTARLEFKLVNESALPTDIAQGIAEPGQQIFPYSPDSGFAGQSVAVYRLGGIDGNSLIKAQASRNQENQDVVVITFDQQGGARFAKLTSENVRKQFAIILDGQVISAPVINDPILGGVSEISGNFTAESAQQLAISLQSGALPVDLTVVEERTVGPDLGAESIRLGIIAMIVGSAAVVALMIATYGRFGVYATIALVFNVLMILGIMALMNTTLTLPGIAGFVLTIGAAVDANVLINERIREERKRGRRVVAAVENGYREASRAIFDANITNFIAGALLFMFGTGPVRGFAVVLVIGLFTSVFTAVSLTRMWVAGWLRKARPQDIRL